MKRRITAKFIAGCVVWVVGAGVTSMAYNRLSLGTGGGFWVGAFIILAWAVIAYTIIWGEVFDCGCSCHTEHSGDGDDSEQCETPIARVGRRGLRGGPFGRSAEEGKHNAGREAADASEAQASGVVRTPRHKLS